MDGGLKDRMDEIGMPGRSMNLPTEENVMPRRKLASRSMPGACLHLGPRCHAINYLR